MNSTQRRTSIEAYFCKPDFVAGFRDAWRDAPPDYASRTYAQQLAPYEIGRQFAVWLRSHGKSGSRLPCLTKRDFRAMARETGQPGIIGINR